MVPSPVTAHQGLREAAIRRAALLAELKQLADTGRGIECIPLLVDRADRDKAILALHVWQADQAIFGSSHARACKHLAQTCDWCGTRPKHSYGTLTVGWLLDARTNGARRLAWLTALAADPMIAAWTPDPPDPYR
ncbi:hypothetical protein PG2022B_1927 [Bifidobacterium animalis subsp. animalis]|nr:hypothetical protein PG2022B_1927 [Bifidobacterium animalis subsp. animalis]